VVAGSTAGIIIITIAAIWAPHIQQFDSIVKYFQQILAYMPAGVAVFLTACSGTRQRHGCLCWLAVWLGDGRGLMLVSNTRRSATGISSTSRRWFSVVARIIAAVSLLTAPPSAAVVQRFVWNMSFFREETRNWRVAVVQKLPRALGAAADRGGLFVFIWR